MNLKESSIFTLGRWCIIAIVIVSALSQFVGGARGRYDKRHSDAAKSDYIFLEALRYEADDSLDAYYDLLSRAYELNPSDRYIGYCYGLYQYLIYDDDSAQLAQQGLELMHRYVLENPEDYLSGLRLATAYAGSGLVDKSLDIFRRLYNASTDPRVTGSAYANALAYTFDKDSLRKAVEVINEVERYTGIDEASVGARTKFYNMLGDSLAIIDEIRRYYEKEPRQVDRVLLMADVYAQYGVSDSAMMFFDRAVDLDPTSGIALFSRAQGYMTIGDTTSAVNEICRAMKYPDLDVDTKMQILQTFVMNEMSDSAVISDTLYQSILLDLTRQYPFNDQVRTQYGMVLYHNDDPAGAAEQFSYALEQNPDLPELWQFLAATYYEIGETDKAADVVNKALVYFPNNVQLMLQTSSIELQRENYRRAYEVLDQALEVGVDSTDNETKAQIYGAMGDIAYREKSLDKAWDYYNTALEYDASNTLLLNNVAYYLACEDRDLEKAQEYVEKALEYEMVLSEANSPNTLDTYAWVLFKRKNYPKAFEVINQVLELSTEESSELLEHAGDIYFMNGHPDEALEFWTKALELDPDNKLLRRKVTNKTFFFE